LDSDPLPVFVSFAIIIILVLLNAFFVAAEFAIVKIRNSRIDTLIEEGNKRAKFVSRIMNNMNAYLSACQLGVTLASLGLGWIGEPAVSRMLEPLLTRFGVPIPVIHGISFFVAFTVITSIHITVGEQYPKTYAIRKAETIALWSALPLIAFYKLMYPFIWCLNGTSNWMLRKSGIEPESEYEAVHTEDEIRGLMKESHKSGYIDNTELTLVDNVFDFTETNAREIMIPRTEMACLYANQTIEDIRQYVAEDKHTRYPVCDPDKDNIVGFIHIRDLIDKDKIKNISAIVRPLMTIPESMPISSLLRLMQKKRTEMALLIDEYGGTSGLVTVEDIIEEIVGEIHDEFDSEIPTIVKKDERTYSVDGLLNIDDVNQFFELNIENEDHDSIGGWMYSQVETPPKLNQRVRFMGYDFIVEEVDHLRISRISIRRLMEPKEEVLQQSVS
jgi:CBS domain containing-hemolysin-like protein